MADVLPLKSILLPPF